MFEGDRRILNRLKGRKVAKDKRGRLKDYAVSAGRGAFLGASADFLSPYSGKKSLLFPLIGAGALAGAGYEAYKGSRLNKAAALENFCMVKSAGEDSVWSKIKAGWAASQYSPEQIKQIGKRGYIVHPKGALQKRAAKAALENFYICKEASKAPWYDVKGRYKEERAKAINAKPPTPKDFNFYLGSMYHAKGSGSNVRLPTIPTREK